MRDNLMNLMQSAPGEKAEPFARPLRKQTDLLQPPVPTVSVVDDDEDLHLLFKDLGDSGYFRLAPPYYDATQALERLPKERPDAVIMDLRLPDMSGIDCLGKLKTILPDLPIIVLTGYPDSRNFFRS